MTGGKTKRTCNQYKQYFVTLDRALPHGCKLMGFKTKTVSSKVVYQTSGMFCQGFEAKSGEKRV
jgi:hypothetical protein